MSGIIVYLSFCDRLISFSTTPSESMRVAAGGKISFFFMAQSYSFVYTYYLFFIRLSTDGHLGCIHSLATVRTAAVNIWMHVSSQFSVLNVFR